MWTIIVLAVIAALFIYGWNHNDKDTRELVSIGGGIAFSIYMLITGDSFVQSVLGGLGVFGIMLWVLYEQEEKQKTRHGTSSSTGTSRSTSALITMDNPQVAALINEVVPVIDDMIKARHFAYLFTDDWRDYDPWIGRYIGDLTFTDKKTAKIHIIIQASNFQDLRNQHFDPRWGADFIRSKEVLINGFLEKYSYTPRMLGGDCGYEYTSHNCITISRKHFSEDIRKQLEDLLKTEWQKHTSEDKETSFLYI